ncbi:hypothetical protein B296_00042092 [Ensete ventricosum]|uniref:Uncharacterized protein n=1 Tax=Ensete ventricosum TaxID=4639 RepID=A0A426XER4_ENSVE|nr:hypothetical protein B296_00042092 [Ensete ventricosum]
MDAIDNDLKKRAVTKICRLSAGSSGSICGAGDRKCQGYRSVGGAGDRDGMAMDRLLRLIGDDDRDSRGRRRCGSGRRRRGSRCCREEVCVYNR